MKKLVLMLGVWLMGHAIQAQYFCTVQETGLEYVNYDEAGQSISNEHVSVTQVKKQDSQVSAVYFTKVVANKAKNNTSYTLYNWTYDGDNTVCEEDLMYGPYIASDSDPAAYNEVIRQAWMIDKKFKGSNAFTLSDGMKAGDTLPDHSYAYLNPVLKSEVTISGGACMGTEAVNTTAGNFDCLKISYLKREKILVKTTTLRVTKWYAKGVGLVKSEAYDMKGKLYRKTLLVKINGK